MSIHEDIQLYMKQYAPQYGPCKLVFVQQWLDDQEKSTAIIETWKTNGENTERKQFKVFYSGGNLTHQELSPTEWAPHSY